MCIYYGNSPDLTYEKREHVFPAGLGGKMMLPIGCVSDQANELFSPLEAALMHDSLISVTRVLFGPGKRGSRSMKKASKSNISVLKNSDGKVALGYMSGKRGYYINSLSKQQNQFIFTVSSEMHNDPLQAWESFKYASLTLGEKFVLLHSAYLGKYDWVYGTYGGKHYIALGPGCVIETTRKELSFIATTSKPGITNKRLDHPTFDIASVESDLTSRMYAKVAINVLAALKGDAYISHYRFVPIKNWILGKTDVDDYSQLPRITPENKLKFPEQCHWCIFLNYNGKLCVTVCFYNAYSRYFELADSIPALDHSSNGIFGMICDWKNQREYTIEQWILETATSFV